MSDKVTRLVNTRTSIGRGSLINRETILVHYAPKVSSIVNLSLKEKNMHPIRIRVFITVCNRLVVYVSNLYGSTEVLGRREFPSSR